MPFKKGNKEGAKTKGHGGLSAEVQKAKALTRQEFLETTTQLLRYTPQQICNVVNDPMSPALTCLIGTIIVKAIDEGDDKRANFVLENTVGKLTSNIALKAPPTVIIRVPERD